jgi:uncharacterized protein
VFLSPRFPRHAALWARVEPVLPPGELAHDRHHLERVYRWSLRLAPEAGADADLSGAAALVHDLALVPKDSPQRALGGERSATLAGAALSAAGYSEAECAAVCGAVRTSSWSRGLAPEGPLGVVLQDADRLDAIGALGLMRNLSCAQWMSHPDRPGRFYDPADPFHESPRALDDRRNALDHCFAKLLRLAAAMRLPSAHAEAARRHATMTAFIAALRIELGIDQGG